MGTMILQYRKQLLVAMAAVLLVAGGFWLGRATDRPPEEASGFTLMNNQMEAALATPVPAASGKGAEATQPVSPERESPSASSVEGNNAELPSADPLLQDKETEQGVAAAVPAPAGEASADSQIPAAAAPDTGLIDLNSATLEELMELPRIGETKAKAIIQYREEHGGFRMASEITEVKGIGEKTYASFKDRITVRK
ncbi:ComEA family DNA-binding protein [Gorillibacterium sp. CAU 1737]|uniref:ComEA family DNA-binding protein n=1 Tax=Gorillibacterium sp. CAU 1737 TaxID=3140362 RepID=UPI0032617636